MDAKMQEALLHCETDIKGSLQRFYGNEDIYISYLRAFPDEPTMRELCEAVSSGLWEDAFIAAHALKGLAGNLGFVPLYHAIGELVVSLRAGKYDEIQGVFEQTRNCYDDLVRAIQTV